MDVKMYLILMSICIFPNTTDLEQLFKFLLQFLIIVIPNLHTLGNFPFKAFNHVSFDLFVFFPIDLLGFYILNNNPEVW